MNSVLLDSFETWRAHGLPWGQEDQDRTWIPYNQHVKSWLGTTGNPKTHTKKTMYNYAFILLTSNDMKKLLDVC